jgi:caspase domain-containing protein
VIEIFKKRFLIGGLVVAACTLALANPPANAQAPDQTPPALRVRSPFGGPVWRLDVDKAENFAVLSNASNAAAIWSFSDPDVPLIARVPLREEQKKRAHAVAMSPDGEVVAYSVPPLADANYRLTPASSLIYVLRRSTGAIERVISGAENDIVTRPQALRFSPDGKHLAAVLSSGCGLRVWSTADWRLVAKDDKGYGGGDQTVDRCCRTDDGSVCDGLPDTTDVRFIRGNRAEPALITSGDSGVRLYERTGNGFGVKKFAAPKDLGLERPEAIAVSPDEKRLAIGDRRGNIPQGEIQIRVAIVDSSELRPTGAQLQIREPHLKFSGFILPQPGNALNFANLHRVAWLKADGREYIFAAGDLACAFLKTELVQPAPETVQDACIARWTVGEEGKDPLFIPAGSDQVMDLVALQIRSALLVATQKLVELVRPDGTLSQLVGGKTFLHRNGIADFRDGQVDFKISDDARVVEFRDYRKPANGEIRLTFDLNNLRITPSGSGGAAKIVPNQDENIIKNWKNAFAKNPPVLWGTELKGPNYWKDEYYRSVAVLDSKKFVLVGSSEFLRVIGYADDKLPVLCSEPVTAEAFRVNVTPDGAIAVSGHSDGTLRWYRILQQGNRCQFELLLSVYLFQESGPRGEWRWIAWRPSGQFAQDSNAQMVMEWQTADTDGRVLLTSFNQVGRKWYAMDAVKTALAPPPPGRGPDEIRKAQTPDAQAIRAEGAPASLSVEIRASTPIDKVINPTMPLSLQLEKAGSWPKKLQIKIADTRVTKLSKGQRLGPDEPIVFEKPVGDDEDILVDVEIPKNARMTNGDKTLCFYVNGKEDLCRSMSWAGEVYKPAKRRLWAVLIGISRYDESPLNLEYAENDVLDVAELFVRDYETRVEHKISSAPADYQEIHINLVASPFSDEAKNEANALEKKGRVKQFEPTKAGIMAAIEDMVARMNIANDRETGDDVFLFLFSGHGAIYTASNGERETIFATPKTSRTAALREIESTSLVSSELFAAIDRVRYGQKLVVLDACRKLAALGGVLPSGGAFKSELDRLYLSIDFFFSSEAGQESVETPGLGFDTTRKNKGNSLLTYVLLESLTTGKSADQGPVHVLIDDVRSYLRHFFGDQDEKSRIKALQAQYKWPYIQIPAILNARTNFGSGVIRTREGK